MNKDIVIQEVEVYPPETQLTERHWNWLYEAACDRVLKLCRELTEIAQQEGHSSMFHAMVVDLREGLIFLDRLGEHIDKVGFREEDDA